MTRLVFERVCRVVALGCLLALLALTVRERQRGPRSARREVVALSNTVGADSTARDLQALRKAVLTMAAHAGAPDTLLLPLRAVPPAPVRAAVHAMRTAGVPVLWSDSTGARDLALSVARAPVPGAPLTVRVSGARGAAVQLRDAGGLLDSTAATGLVHAWSLQSASPPLTVQVARGRATAALPDSVAARRLLVVADPGWESKFVVAALEEAGWQVDGRFRVSPTGAVTVGAPLKLDTARYAAVLVLDSTTVNAAALSTFVSQGGGLVLGGDALRLPALSALRPARATSLRGGIAGALLTDTPRRGLEAWEVEPAANVVVLEEDRGDHSHAEPALLARRVGAGRVVAMPYRETWRWRMEGSDAGMAEHREWWHSAVTAAVDGQRVASPAAAPLTDALPGEAAPYADLVARSGAPLPAWTSDEGVNTMRDANGRANGRSLSWSLLLLLSALAALLAEWTSRRLRGLR
jgi:hypothetical protein